jgi:hypothetical protein
VSLRPDVRVAGARCAYGERVSALGVYGWWLELPANTPSFFDLTQDTSHLTDTCQSFQLLSSQISTNPPSGPIWYIPTNQLFKQQW